jgi:hypothetical protein
MTDCTERHPAAPGGGMAGEGQKGMRHPAAPGGGMAGEGQKNVAKEAQP